MLHNAVTVYIRTFTFFVLKNVVDIICPICYIRRCKAYCFAYGANRGIPRDKLRLTCLRLGNHVHINSTSYFHGV